MEIQIVDFNDCFENGQNKIENAALTEAGMKLYETFSRDGFAYITTSVITREDVLEIDSLSRKFFGLPTEEKTMFFNGRLGLTYLPIGTRKYHSKDIKKPDYVEGFRVPYITCDNKWPNIPGFSEKIRKFEEKCKLIGLQVFKSLGMAMKLKDKDKFYNSHHLLNCEGNPSSLKLLHYPPVNDDVISEGVQTRFPEHTDFGSLTFLFGDDLSGLQVKNSDGEYKNISNVPDSILINVGDELQYWTGGRLKSTMHRVIVPDDKEKRLQSRRSIAFFFQIDNDVLLDKLEFEDGSIATTDGWTAMSSEQFIAKRFKETYY
uniref:2-oxoglutarate-dependent dioxygenase ecdK-like isoform X1 n=1 Tax=Styela clava TaxID=7725 RepID=UPI0019399828|nr:2-oxoglutarate-dependent dioxygenase ecdK-like isoform X1 [Styela clava]